MTPPKSLEERAKHGLVFYSYPRNYGKTKIILDTFKESKEESMHILCFDKSHAERTMDKYRGLGFDLEVVEHSHYGQPITIVNDEFNSMEPIIRTFPNETKSYSIKLTKRPI
jgi:hypothetical protein